MRFQENFNERFGEGNWSAQILDISSDKVSERPKELTKALDVRVFDVDSAHGDAGVGGFYFFMGSLMS